MAQQVLLCSPKYYQIEYEINPWMHLEKKVDQNRAREEFAQLVELYKTLEFDIQYINPQPGLPDMVYAANFGFVIDNTFIKSSFKYPQRRKEADFAADYFKKKGFQVRTLPEDVFFEGRGDMFYRDGIFYLGHGKRTMPAAVGFLQDLLGTDIVTFETNDPFPDDNCPVLGH